jgi:transcriptional regulator with XRE-family HTH domain
MPGTHVSYQRSLAQAGYDSLEPEVREKVIEWITANVAPASKIYPYSSYCLKHDAEDAIGHYIRNHEFKGAMLVCGYEPTPGSEGDVNWRYRIKWKLPANQRPPFGQRGLGGLGGFGPMVRQQREAQGIGLRELSRRVGMSPAYLSKVETDQFRPPAEEKLVAIAKELKLDPDAVIAQAGRIPADVIATMKQHPVEMAKLIRAVAQLAEDKNGQ